MSLSKRPFEPGTLVKARPRKPYKGSVDVQLYDRVYCSRSHRRDAFDNYRRVPGHGYWTVVGQQCVRGVGWWHEIVRVTTDDAPHRSCEKGWVEDLQKDFVVCKDEHPDV